MKSLKAILCAVMMLTVAAAYAEDADKKEPEKKEVSDNKASEKKESKSKRTAPSSLITLSDSHFSGYGALACQETRIAKSFATLVGGRGGLIVNDNFVMGFSGYGLAYPSKRSDLADKKYTGDYPYMSFGYGGLLLEYHFAPKSLVHFSVGMTIGGGGYSFTHDNWEDDDDRDNDDDDLYADHSESNMFFVAEPEIGVWVNVTRFSRIGAIVSYRLTNGADGGGFKDKDFRSVNITGMAQFGWF
jgi:hypothetical protein